MQVTATRFKGVNKYDMWKHSQDLTCGNETALRLEMDMWKHNHACTIHITCTISSLAQNGSQ